MSPGLVLALIALVAVALPGGTASAAGVSLSHVEPLSDMRLSPIDHEHALVVDGHSPLSLEFNALGRSFELELEPNARLLAAMKASAITSRVAPYRGRLANNPDSWASIVIVNGTPAGLIYDGRELIAIEAPGDALVESSEPIVFRVADAVIAPGAMTCAAGQAGSNGQELFAATANEVRTALARAPGAVSEISIGAVGDFEFSHTRTDPESAIIARLNNVDVYFSEQVGVQINVTVVDTFTTTDDPFSDTNDPGNLLDQLASYRSTTPSQRAQGLTHLYTGRDLAGSTVGIAYTEALCLPYYGAGLSEGNEGLTFDSLVAAHEIGHNFGAVHDGDDEPCQDVVGQYIMSASLNGSEEFSQCSIDIMQAHAAEVACVTPLPSTDISLDYAGAPPSVLLSNAATVTFDVINNGTQMATNISVDIVVPDNVELLAASGSTGPCESGAGTVTCQPADLAGGSSATISLSGTTIATGVGVFDATVTAAADDNLSNNNVSVSLTVGPAVDLVANAPLPAELQVDRSTSIAVIIENESTLASSPVSLRIALSAGLRATSASWPAGSCTVTDSQVDCSAASLGGEATATLALGIAGVTRGAQSFTVTVSSADTDADPANNSATGTVSVTASATNGGNGDDGGSGGLGFGFLWALGFAAAMRARRRA